MEAELTPKLKKSMRGYAVKVFILPVVAVSVAAFILGSRMSGAAVEDVTPAFPAGSIVVYLGDSLDAPDGWLFCKGDDIPSGDTYTGLRQALSRAPGVPEDKLPDLRGVFLRGLDTRSPGQGGRDPDSTRNLGDFQQGSIRGHFHAYQETSLTTGEDEEGEEQAVGGQAAVRGTGSVGGAETRPKNVTVNFLIKY